MNTYNLYIIFLIVFIAVKPNLSQQFTFSPLNGPYGGNLGDVVCTSDGKLFVSSYYSAGKGIYKSDDHGLNWELLPPISRYNEIFALGVDKNDVIYAGTSGEGLYRSTDKGESWTRLNSYYGPECWAIDFNSKGDIFAGDGDWGGLYKSTDSGETWAQVLPIPVAVLSIKIDNAGTIYIGASNEFLKSTDDGITWNSYYSGLPSLEISTVIINQQNEIFAGTGYIMQGDGVYYSTNGGENWIQRGLSGQTIYSLTMNDSGTLFAGTQDSGVYKSTDNGLSWQQVNNGLYNKNIFRVKIGPGNLLFACSDSDGGIYRSSNSGESWKITGITAGTIMRAIINETGEIFAATNFGVQKYNSQTRDWSILGLTSVSSVRGWNWISDIVITSDGNMFVSSWAGDVYKTTDNGITWHSTASIDTAQAHIADMALYPDNSILLGTYHYIKRSTDKGITWSIKKDGLPHSIIDNIEVTEEGIIYAVSGNKLCRANHIDSSFVVIHENIANASFWVFNTLSSGNDGLIFLAYERTNQGIYRSKDYGETWSKIYNGAVYSLSLFNDKYVTAGLSGGEGILYSSNLGDTWEYINEGIHPDATFSWNRISTDGYLYASANGLGLYKSNSIVTGIDDQPAPDINSYTLEQNYPNPFNPETRIKYIIKETGLVSLKVYDILGNEIAILVNEVRSAGSYETDFDASALTSGIYFYELISGNFREAKKMLLIQ